MKTKILIAMWLLVSAIVSASDKGTSKSDGTIKNDALATTLPVFTWERFSKEGMQGNSPFLIYSYLRENVEYPDKALRYNIQGTEVVQFMVTNEGEVTNIKVLNSVSPEIDYEVIRVISGTSGMWEPALNNGKPVDMKREISLTFQISGFKRNHFQEKATNLFKKGSYELHSQHNPEKALKYFDKALRYLPYESTILNSRAIAKSLLNDKDGAQQDWDRVDTILAAKSEREKNLQLFTQNDGDVKVNQENQIIISK